MKLKIYSVLLLLTFFIAVSHDMIPHHHHDIGEYGIPFQSDISEHHHHSDDSNLYHHGEDSHQHESANNTEKKHQHNFPYHQHLSANNDYIVFRTELERNLNVNFKIAAVLFEISAIKLSHPPEIDFIRFTDKPFLISTIFEPGAIGLRDPPSIA